MAKTQAEGPLPCVPAESSVLTEISSDLTDDMKKILPRRPVKKQRSGEDLFAVTLEGNDDMPNPLHKKTRPFKGDVSVFKENRSYRLKIKDKEKMQFCSQIKIEKNLIVCKNPEGGKRQCVIAVGVGEFVRET